MMLPIPGLSTAKLIGFGLGALALIAAFFWFRGVLNERAELRDWRDGIVLVVQSEVPVERRKSVTAKTAADEIHWLGREYRTHWQALLEQTRRLNIAKGKTEAAQNSATEAARRAVEADKARKAIRDRLTAPTRSGGLAADEWSQL